MEHLLHQADAYEIHEEFGHVQTSALQDKHNPGNLRGEYGTRSGSLRTTPQGDPTVDGETNRRR